LQTLLFWILYTPLPNPAKLVSGRETIEEIAIEAEYAANLHPAGVSHHGFGLRKLGESASPREGVYLPHDASNGGYAAEPDSGRVLTAASIP
jgi:hypothetical protein